MVPYFESYFINIKKLMQVTVNSDILDECVTFGDYIKVLTEEISDQTKLYKYRI